MSQESTSDREIWNFNREPWGEVYSPSQNDVSKCGQNCVFEFCCYVFIAFSGFLFVPLLITSISDPNALVSIFPWSDPTETAYWAASFWGYALAFGVFLRVLYEYGKRREE
ncbi:MAG: hypothetical protein ACFFER_08470 [Candidatus Thorarchaeota archaeon]